MPDQQEKFDFDFIIIGSGFGGSVCAHRLTEKGYKVAVMEMGRRWKPEDLPRTSWSVHRWFWRPRLGLRGFFNMRFFRHVTIYHGCAVGGGSITYGATLLQPPREVWTSGTWSPLCDWNTSMSRHYATAERMLGITENQILGPADYLLRSTAEAVGCSQTFYRTKVGIFQPSDNTAGQTHADPFFSQQGPPRWACIACGGCIMGCRYGAKNTLDLNYLYLAEKHGASVFPERKVVDVKPLDGSPDGGNGYEVYTVRSTSWFARDPQQFTCRAVVFSASALGTMELLFRLREKHSLPAISAQLGKHVRTNSESLIGARMPGSTEDYSQGISIGSGVYIDAHTHIEAVRYPRGSDTMGLLTTVLTDGEPGSGRIALWARNILTSLLRHPIRSWRMARPSGWARESVILLCMQALDGEIQMDWRRPWFWPFRKFLVSSGQKVPTYIPQANHFARKFAEVAGGTGMSTLPEILFDVPGTAHCIGGCVIADSATHGVVDSQQRVFGYQNMYICDGSVIAANLGVNPSLTITALAERAMSFVPEKAREANDHASPAPTA
jgi:cholesterol oxidase